MTAASGRRRRDVREGRASRSRSGSRRRCASWRRLIIPLGRPATPRGRRRPDLLPLLAVVELRPRPGDHRERRPDDRDDVMSFDLDAIGRAGDERRYEVTEDALRAYADATDDVPGGPVFAIVPVWETIAPASRSVASDEARKRVVHYEQDMMLHRPIEAGMTLVSQRDAGRAARPAERHVARDQDGDADRRRRARQRAVRDRVLPRRRDRARASASVRPTTGSSPTGIRSPRSRIPSPRTRPCRYAAASGDDFAIHLDDEFARKVGLPGRIVHGLCTMAFAGRAVLEAAGVDDPRRGQAPRRPLLRAALSRRDGDDPSLARRRWLRLRIA